MSRCARSVVLPLAGLLLALHGAGAAAAQGWGVTFSVQQLAERDVQPGATVTTAIKVTNAERAPVTLRPRIEPPRGWAVVSGGADLALRAGESRVWLVTVAVPGEAPVGSHPAAVSLTRAEGGRRLFEYTLTMRVAASIRPRVTLASPPPFALAGQTVALPFHVQNAGNAKGRFELEVARTGGLAASVRTSSFTLSPGEIRFDTVTVRVGRDLVASEKGRVDLRLVAGDGGSAEASAGAEIALLPAPRSPGADLHRLPLQVRLRAGDGEGVAPLLVEASGSARLMEGRGPVLDLTLRRTGTRFDRFGEMEQYSATLRGERASLRLGDHFFDGSMVAGGAELGRGGGVAAAAAGWALEGFYYRPRQSMEPADRLGVLLARDLGRMGRLTGRWASTDSGSVASVRWSGGLLPGNSLEVEVGEQLGGAARGRALALETRGQHGPLSYSLSHREAAPTFLGPLRGVASTYAFGSFALPWGSRVGGYHSRSATGATPGDPLAYTGGERSGGVFADLFGRVTVEYQRGERESGPADERRREATRAVRARAAQRLGPLTVSASAERGETEDRVTGERFPTQKLGGTASLAVGRSQSLSAYADYEEGRPGADGTASPGTWTGGVNALVGLWGRARLQLSAQDEARDGWTRERVQRVELRLDQRLAGGRIASIRLQAPAVDYRLSLAESRLAFEYSIPVGVPIGPSRQAGRVVGRVTDAESGRAVPGAVVRLGDQMEVTGPDGYVVFRGLPAGEHAVAVPFAGSGPGRLTAGDSLVTVTGDVGRTAAFRLGLVRGGRIRGTVRQLPRALAADGAPAPEGPATPAAGVQVVLASGADTLRIVTDAQGGFLSGEVRPGHWTAGVDPATLHDPAALAADPVGVTVVPGSTAEADLVVRQRKREVRMMTEGELVVERVKGGTPSRAPESPPRAPAPAPAPTPAPSPTRPQARSYVVLPGDRLTRIARVFYGDARLWVRIWLANRDLLPDPNHLLPRTRLRIPPAEPRARR